MCGKIVVVFVTFPTGRNELIQVASHHYFLPLDNLSYLDWEDSDRICRLVTGSGTSKRRLYTDDEDVVYNFRRVVAMNGVNIAADKADLLDRCLLIGLERVGQFESEPIFWKRFEDAKPRILGSIFTALVKTLEVAETDSRAEVFRMSDFARFGCAFAQAIGLRQEDFLVAYRENLEVQNREALAASLVGTALEHAMENGLNVEDGKWTATPSSFLSQLKSSAEQLGIDTKQRLWPKNPNWAIRRVMEVKTNLERIGIHVYWHHLNNRTITIVKDPETDENVPNVGNVERPAVGGDQQTLL